MRSSHAGKFVPVRVLAPLAVILICGSYLARPVSAQSSWPSYPNNTAISVTSGSNVGIGTTNPTYPLDVVGVARIRYPSLGGFALSLGSYSDGRDWWFRDDAGVNRFRFSRGSSDATVWDVLKTPGSDAIAAQYFCTNGAYRLTIDGNGNIGIGTTAPQYKLAVNGTIGAKDVIVTNTGWADYVFRPGYRLRRLDEVGAYIRQHGRLPGIPSESEVQEKGVSLGEMQVKLLAKIEELTLHMIEEHRRNDRLEQQNRELQERIGRLEANREGLQ